MGRPLWQKSVIAVLLTGLVIWLSYTYLLKDKLKEMSELKSSVDMIQKEINALGGGDLTLDARTINREINKRLHEINIKVPSEADSPYLLERFIAESLKGLDIDYTSIQPLAPVKEDVFKRIPINIDMTARFEPLNMYLQRIESLPITVRIDSMDISKNRDKPQLLNVKVSLSAFVMPGAPSSVTGEATPNMSQIPGIDPFYEEELKAQKLAEIKKSAAALPSAKRRQVAMPKFKGVYKGERTKAFINNDLFGVGDVVDNYIITKITDRYVIVTKDGKGYTLKLGGEGKR